jgi:SRSO17 transposase
VGVFLGYVNGSRRTLIDGQLYLPADWANNSRLRNKCKVPKDVRFRTKAEIVLDMVLNARKNGVPFGWVGMDCFYGEQSHLRNKLDAEGLIYIADIPRDTRVWIKESGSKCLRSAYQNEREIEAGYHRANGFSTVNLSR